MSLQNSKKHILFITTNFWAYGELFIALEAGEALRNTEFVPTYLISPSHERLVKGKGFPYVCLIPKSAKLNQCLLKEIETTYRPSHIVLADYINYALCERHYGLRLDDLAVFSGKLGTLDLYDHRRVARGGFDTYGFSAKEMKGLTADHCEFKLQPAPVLHAKRHRNNPNVFRYPLFHSIVPNSLTRRKNAREYLGIKPEEKLVLLTSGSWQASPSEIHAEVKAFMGACRQALENLLFELPDHVKIICVGSKTLFTTKENKNFIQKGQMGLGYESKFRDCFEACDLFISMNSISTSMLEIVLCGVPTLLLSNSFLKKETRKKWIDSHDETEPDELKECPLAYPFRMFPIGWYKALGEIGKNNDFYSLIHHGELFRKKETLSLIDNLLNDGSRDVNNSKLQKYKEKLDRLDQLPDVFRII